MAVPDFNFNFNFSSLSELFLKSVEKYGDRTAFICLNQKISFNQLAEKAKSFANYLIHFGKIQPQDRVAIMLPNMIQYPVVLFGILLAGGVVVNLNPLDKASAILHELKNSDAKIIVVLENFIEELGQIIDQTSIQQVILTSIGAMYPWYLKNLINFYLRHIKKIVPQWTIPGSIRLKKALALGKLSGEYNFNINNFDINNLAFLQYTSGTTGLPKGAMLSHKNILANLFQAKTWAGDLFQSGHDKIMTPLPLYHIFSLTANCLLFVYLGVENILILNPKDLKNLIKILKQEKISALTGVNTLFAALVNHKDFKYINFSSLKLTLGGGMSVLPSVAECWRKLTGNSICQAYGLTEASPAVCINPPNDLFDGTVGYPVSMTEIGIFNSEGKKLAQGEAGELWIKGPQIMQGYFKNQAATEEVLTHEGWLKTGDIAQILPNGKVKIIDRLKDIIIVSGFNVSPLEVEAAISQLDFVQEVGVVGIPDEVHGEQVVACIFLKPDFKKPESKISWDILESKIKAHGRKLLAAYKAPKKISFYEKNLPKNNLGKLLHRELKKIELEKIKNKK